MFSPFFTVIIPTYNRTDLLTRAVESVKQQTFQNFECLIVDDGSSVIWDRPFLPVHFRYFYLKKNRGVSFARNWGWALAKGEWICLLDSDDEWMEEKLEECYRFILEIKGSRVPHASLDRFKIFQTDEFWVRNGERVTLPKKHKKTEGDLFEISLEKCSITPSSVVFKNSLLREGFRFDESLPACEDYDLWIRLSAYYSVFLLKKKLTIRYQGHPDQLSFRYPLMDIFRIRSLRRLMTSCGLSSKQMIAAQKVYQKKWTILFQGASKRNRLGLLIHLLLQYWVYQIKKRIFYFFVCFVL